MKKRITTLGAILALLAFTTSCSKEVDNSLPDVTPESLSGNYKIVEASVAEPVDLNNDGKSSKDLLAEGYNFCERKIEITKTIFAIVREGSSCNAQDVSEVYSYKYGEKKHVSGGKIKIIELSINSEVVKTFESVSFYDRESYANKRILSYHVFDEDLQQEIYFDLMKE